MPPLLPRQRTAHQIRVDAMTKRIREIGKKSVLPDQPVQPPADEVMSQARLIVEECLEALEACGIGLFIDPCNSGEMSQGAGRPIKMSDIMFHKISPLPYNLSEVAKELADLSVVCTGMFSIFGIADQAILEAVDDNNLQKFGSGGYLDANGKWKKPLDHPKPDIAGLLNQQRLAEPEEDNYENSADVFVSHGSDR